MKKLSLLFFAFTFSLLFYACADKKPVNAKPEEMNTATDSTISGDKSDTFTCSEEELKKIEETAKEEGNKVDQGGDEKGTEKQSGGAWPTDDFCKQVPPPKAGTITGAKSGEQASYVVVSMTMDECKEYVEYLQEQGFNVDPCIQSDENGDYYTFEAQNNGGYTVSLAFNNDIVIIDIFKLF